MKKNLLLLFFFSSIVSCFSQDFKIVGMSLKGGGSNMEIKFDGKLVLEENHILINTPMGTSEGTTFINKKGLISFQSENKLQTLKVSEEIGNFKKLAYDTKIIIYCIDEIGGLTTTLYCKLNL